VSLQLFGHPFSSYTMKALIALYENETPFDFRILDPDHPENGAELARRWPVARFLLLVDGGTTVFETSAIIEHLAAFHPGALSTRPG
jgi:glutathione S-transferase